MRTLLLTVLCAAPAFADDKRDAAVAALAKNGLSVSGLTLAAKDGGPCINLGTGVNGGENDTCNDANLALVAQVPEVERLFLYKGRFTADGLRALSALPNLKAVNIYAPAVAPEAFAGLADCKRLQTVCIGGYAVTDDILGYLRGLSDLTGFEATDGQKLTALGLADFLTDRDQMKRLLLLGAPLDDAGMKEVGTMTKLTRFWIDSPAVTAKGWVHLAGLTEMRDLYLRGTKIDDAGVKHLAGMTKMESLMLDKTGLTDAGMPSLAGMTDLSDLGMEGTKITNAGMTQLRKLTKLNNLYVGNTAVTAKGLAEVPSKNRMVMMRAGTGPLSPAQYAEMAEMYPKTQLFDPSGYWTEGRIKAAMKALGKDAPKK